LASETIAAGGQLGGAQWSFARGAQGRLTGLTLVKPGGGVAANISYGYHPMTSRLETVNDAVSGVTAAYAYLANSDLVETVTLGQGGTNRMVQTRGTDALGRPWRVANSLAGGGMVSSTAYQYDSRGRRQQAVLESSRSVLYGYNAAKVVTRDR
jgi:hypothetical protein